MTATEKELKEFFDSTFRVMFEGMTVDELKRIDWFVYDADQFIQQKQQKSA